MKYYCLLDCISGDKGLVDLDNGIFRRFYFENLDDAKEFLIKTFAEELNYNYDGDFKKFKEFCKKNHYYDYGKMIFEDKHIYFVFSTQIIIELKIIEFDFDYDINLKKLNGICKKVNRLVYYTKSNER